MSDALEALETRLNQRIAALEDCVAVDKAVEARIALITDAAACELRQNALRQKHSAIRSAEKKLDADRLAFDEYKAKEIAEAEELKKTAASIWDRAATRERAVEAREQACNEREIELGLRAHDPADEFVPIAGSGMSRSYSRSTVRHDRLGQEFAAGTTLSRTPPAPEPTGVRIRGRRGATQAGA